MSITSAIGSIAPPLSAAVWLAVGAAWTGPCFISCSKNALAHWGNANFSFRLRNEAEGTQHWREEIIKLHTLVRGKAINNEAFSYVVNLWVEYRIRGGGSIGCFVSY